MKTVTLTSLFLFFSVISFAQAPPIEWQKSLGGTNQEYGYCVRQTNDGGYIVVGESVSPIGGMITNNYGNYDLWAVKLDSTGAMQWQKCFGGSSYDRAYEVQQTADGGYILGGMTQSNNFDVSGHYGNFDCWIVKLSSAGAIEWQKPLGGSSTDEAFSIQQTTDGGYIFCGYNTSTNGAVTSGVGGWIVKINSTGTIQWQKTAGQYMQCVRQTADGGYIAAGNTNFNGPLGGEDYIVVKLNSAGVIQWTKYFGGTSNDVATCIRQTTDGGYIVGGTSDSSNTDVTNNNGVDDFWVIKLNSAGVLEWQKSLGGSYYEQAYDIQQTSEGGYIVAGSTNSNNNHVSGNHGDQDYWVARLSNTGSLLWQKALGGVGTDVAKSIQQTADGGFVVAGYTGSYDGDVTIQYGDRDFWVVKLSPEDLSTADFSNTKVTIAPNPTKDFFELSNYDHVQKIELYDLTGKKLISKSDFTDGKTAMQNFSNGVYTVKIYLDNGTITADKIVKE